MNHGRTNREIRMTHDHTFSNKNVDSVRIRMLFAWANDENAKALKLRQTREAEVSSRSTGVPSTNQKSNGFKHFADIMLPAYLDLPAEGWFLLQIKNG